MFDLSSYEFIRTLGTGAFGRVRLAQHRTSGEYIAIKSMKKFHLEVRERHARIESVLGPRKDMQEEF